MSVQPAPRTEFDATIEQLMAQDDARRREFVRLRAEQDWDGFVDRAHRASL